MIDLTGQRFGRWLVIKKSPSRKQERRQSRTLWECKCDCGTTRNLIAAVLRNGSSRSCGCLKTEIHTTHGLSNHALVDTWRSIIRRCSDPRHIEWKNYGGRGIKVCQHWLSLPNFIADISTIGERPSKLHTLDRIDNDGNYELSNVRWATKSEQSRNTRKRNSTNLGELASYTLSLPG